MATATTKKTATKTSTGSASKASTGSASKASSNSANKASTGSASKKTKGSKKDYGMEHSKLMEFFEDSLKDIYWAEKALTKALPKMSKKATAPELVKAIEEHLGETEAQVRKLEEVFDSIGKKAQAKKCEAMNGLIKEAEEIMKETDQGAMRDAGIIAAGQKVEHYEIATYGTLTTFARTLGLEHAAKLLHEILEEEKAADEKLTEIAVSTINVHAAETDEDED